LSYSNSIRQLSRRQTNLIRLGMDNVDYWLCDGEPPTDQYYYACVNNIDWIPSRATIDGGLGYFGEIVLTCKDFNTGSAGTFFGKMLASNTYYLNRLLDIYVGYYERGDTFSLANFQKRTYFLKRIDGPDQNGNVKIYASDIISRLKESEVPAATNGHLSVSITDSTTGTINITDNTGFSAGGGYAIIEDEIVSYTGVSGSDSITGVVRAQGGTDAEAHDANSPARNIYTNLSTNVVDAIRDLIEDFTDIDHATYLPDADWNTQRDNYLASEDVDLWVIEPTPVSEVIDKLAEDYFINVWWDDANQEIKLKAIGPQLESIVTWTDEANLLNTKINVKRDQKKVLTEVLYFFGKINQAEGDDAKNFDSVYVNNRASIETALGEKRTKKIFSFAVPTSGTSTASKVSGRLIDQNEVPLELTCYVDAIDSGVDIGDAVSIETDLIQDKNGARQATIMRVIEKAQKENNRYFYKLIKTGQEIIDRYGAITPNTMGEYVAESDINKSNYAFISDNDPDMSNGDNPYLIL
jgi:hypothetical protein